MRQARKGITGWGRTASAVAGRCAPVLAAVVWLAATRAAADDLSVFRPVGQPAVAIRELFYLVLGITGAIFVLVGGALVYSALRFGRKGADDAEPAQIYGSTPLEVAWTIAPLLIVFVLFLVVVRSVVEAQQPGTSGETVRVQVIGHQWWWEINYPDLSVRTANELHVPAGRDGEPVAVSVELLSADVIHSFWVPRLAGKTDVVPGRTNHMWFSAGEPATHLGQCAEFCGVQHANMKIAVMVETDDDFRRWQENERKPAADEAATAAGRARFLALACVNCHTIRGTPAHGTVGPDLTHLMARRTIAAGAAANDRARLRAWIADPDAIKPGSQMPNMHLGDSDVDTLVDYLETLK